MRHRREADPGRQRKLVDNVRGTMSVAIDQHHVATRCAAPGNWLATLLRTGSFPIRLQ